MSTVRVAVPPCESPPAAGDGGLGAVFGVPPNLLAGTSNWSGDYFVRTAGSALVVNQLVSQTGAGTTAGSAASTSTIREQLQAVFERDWSSQYSADIGDAERWESLCGSR